jgi:hypothetical protein
MAYLILPMAYIALLIFGLIGWVMNIIAIVHTASDVVTGMFIARVIGVFVPFVGAVLGWF